MNEYPWTAAFHFAGYDLGGCAATLVWLHFLSIFLSLLLVLCVYVIVQIASKWAVSASHCFFRDGVQTVGPHYNLQQCL